MRKCVLLAASAFFLHAQESGRDTRPRFEAASIKRCREFGPAPSQSSPGRLSLSCWPVRRLIQEAYHLFAEGKANPLNPVFPLVPVENGPGWIDSDRYLIDAETEGAESPGMMRGPMMQRLLEDRFQLRVHRETREEPVYALTAAKGGPKLQPAKAGSCAPFDPFDFTRPFNRGPEEIPWCAVARPQRNGSRLVYDARGMSLDLFARLLGGLDRPVIDRTGIAGVFDIHLEYSLGETSPPAPPTGGEPADPVSQQPIVRAIRQQLGLRLDPAVGPREFLVVDRVERPSEN